MSQTFTSGLFSFKHVVRGFEPRFDLRKLSKELAPRKLDDVTLLVPQPICTFSVSTKYQEKLQQIKLKLFSCNVQFASSICNILFFLAGCELSKISLALEASRNRYSLVITNFYHC